jgi:hypothetical protein
MKSEFSFFPFLVSNLSSGKASSIGSYLNNTGTSFTWFKSQQFFTAKPSVLRQNKNAIENLDLMISYNSGSTRNLGYFGSGWSLNYESFIDLNRSTLSKIIYHDESGKEIEFVPVIGAKELDSLFVSLKIGFPLNMTLKKMSDSSPGKYRLLFEKLSKLVYAGNSESVIRLSIKSRGFFIGEDPTYAFTRQGKLSNILQKRKAQVSVLHDGNDRITAVTDGPHYMVMYYNDSNLISRVRYEDSTEYYFTYSDGLLKSIKNNFNEKQYSYDYNINRMVSKITLVPGTKSLQIPDSVSSDIIDSASYYVPDSSMSLYISYDNQKRKSVIEDKGYSVTRWVYDENDSLSTIIHITGYAPELSYGESAQDSTIYTYNKISNLLKIFSPSNKKFTIYRVTPCACLPLMVVHGALDYPQHYKDSVEASRDSIESLERIMQDSIATVMLLRQDSLFVADLINYLPYFEDTLEAVKAMMKDSSEKIKQDSIASVMLLRQDSLFVTDLINYLPYFEDTLEAVKALMKDSIDIIIQSLRYSSISSNLKTDALPAMKEIYYDSTLYKYDDYGNMTELKSNREHILMHINKLANKVDTVRSFRIYEDTTLLNEFVAYNYDNNSNLTVAEDFLEHKRVELTYNTFNNIESYKYTTISNEADSCYVKSLLFKYNSKNQIAEIILEGLGKIELTYLPSGEVDKINSIAFEKTDYKKVKVKKKKRKKPEEDELLDSPNIASEILHVITFLSDIVAVASKTGESSYRSISDYSARLKADQ